jgi:hypothetical protein
MEGQELINKLETELAKNDPDLVLSRELIKILKDMTMICKECKTDIFKKRVDQVFCSERCSNRYRQRVFRVKKRRY